jgi:hypothetical protein
MQTLLLDTNSVIKKLEQRGFSRAQAEGITDALKKLDASSLVTKTDLELALAKATMMIITWMTGALLAQAWKHWIIATAVGCGLAIIAAGARSAPLGSAARDFRSAAAVGPGFESVRYRRAYHYRARRAYGYRAYGYATPRLWRRSIEYANPNVYPTGSRAWWAVMNRQGRGGRPD